MASGFLFFLLTIGALRSIRKIRDSRIPGLNRTFIEIQQVIQSKAMPMPREATSLVRLDQPAGLFWILGGGLLFLLASVLVQCVAQSLIDGFGCQWGTVENLRYMRFTCFA